MYIYKCTAIMLDACCNHMVLICNTMRNKRDCMPQQIVFRLQDEIQLLHKRMCALSRLRSLRFLDLAHTFHTPYVALFACTFPVPCFFLVRIPTSATR
jgi:hypothetical protein